MARPLYQAWYSDSYALVIGIDAYRFEAQLEYAVSDACAVAKILVTELGFPTSNIRLLVDADATRENILQRYHDLIDQAVDPDSRLLIFFAGHGHTRDGVQEPVGFLVPVDGQANRTGTLIQWRELTRSTDLTQAKHVLFIMDACYSGLAMQRALPAGTEHFLSGLLQRRSVQVITAGKADQPVADAGGPIGGHSLFTGHLLEGLLGKAADANGVLTASALMQYVYDHVGQAPYSEQTPHFGHLSGDGDFILRTPNNEHFIDGPHREFLVHAVTERPETIQPVIQASGPPKYLAANGYKDPTRAQFGRNIWTSRLGEVQIMHDPPQQPYSMLIQQATSWLSITLSPAASYAPSIDTQTEMRQLQARNNSQGERHPIDRFEIPYSRMETIDSVIFYYDEQRLDGPGKYWTRFLRIDERGNIEFAISDRYVFYEFNARRQFNFVAIVGWTWQFLFLAKVILKRYGYEGGAYVYLNLVGTRSTYLFGYSNEPGPDGRFWPSPDDRLTRFMSSRPLESYTCQDANVQLSYQPILGDLTEVSSKTIVVDIARKLSRAFNHQSEPRCFNLGTDTFPWGQFLNDRP